MKYFATLLFIFISTLSAAPAQIDPSSNSYFPVKSDFNEFNAISDDVAFTEASHLSGVPTGKLVSDVGFRKYERRTYVLENSKSLVIEIFTLLDMKAAYSLLTLLRNSSIHVGPPGDEYASASDRIQFSQGDRWINIHGKGVPDEFLKRVALWVSERLGQPPKKRPALISHLPKTGLDDSTLRYFPGIKTLATYSKNLPVWMQACGDDMEIVEAKYTMGNNTGALWLMNFPTDQIAEDCSSKLGAIKSSNGADKEYVKSAGPLVGFLSGPFDEDSADKVMNSIQYNYSVQWIYDKNEKLPGKTRNIFGVPPGILKTVVKSIFFVVWLAFLSLAAGVVFAIVRFRTRRKMSKNALDNEITHLRMR
jgi:hypothetical protein